MERIRKLLGSTQAAYVFILVAAVWLIYLFGFREMRFFMVPSSSMAPTLRSGDQILTLNEEHYRRGDIVVVLVPGEEGYIVKRIVGLPGDTLSIHEGALFLNGEYASEPYIAEPMEYNVVPAVTVPEGEIYVLGDNRNISADSSLDLGTRPLSDVVGRVRYVYYPYARLGALPSYPLTNVSGE